MTDQVFFGIGLLAILWCAGLVSFALAEERRQRRATIDGLTASFGVLLAAQGERRRRERMAPG